MSRRLNIQVIGAGGMGSALAYLIGEVGHSVEVIDQNPAIYESWAKTRRNNLYPYLEEFEFPETVSFRPSENCDSFTTGGYDFTILAVPGNCLIDLLGRLNIARDGGPLVLLQKSAIYTASGLLTPSEVVQYHYRNHRKRPRGRAARQWKPAVITLTGAAFAWNLINRVHSGMILAAHVEDEESAECFKKSVLVPIGSIWPYCTREVEAVGVLNALRTIASCEQGLLDGFLRDRAWESAKAMASVAINQERVGLARFLLHHQAGRERDCDVFEPRSRVYRVLEADMVMCRDISSRNYHLGFQLGSGIERSDANEARLGTVECVQNVDALARTVSVCVCSDNWNKNYPYLNGLWRIFSGVATVQEVADEIMARIPRA